MTPEQNTPECSIAACMVRFASIDSKLDAMHEDMNKLAHKVSNGLAERLNKAENHLALLQQEQQQEAREKEKRERRVARWEMAIISIVVAGAFTLIATFVSHEFKEREKAQQQKQQQQKQKAVP